MHYHTDLTWHRISNCVFLCNDPYQLDDIGMEELPHDGCLLEKLHSADNLFLCHQCLHSYLNGITIRGFPSPSVDCPKLPRSQMVHDSTKIMLTLNNWIAVVWLSSVLTWCPCLKAFWPFACALERIGHPHSLPVLCTFLPYHQHLCHCRLFPTWYYGWTVHFDACVTMWCTSQLSPTSSKTL